MDSVLVARPSCHWSVVGVRMNLSAVTISVRRRDGEVVKDLGWSAASLDLLRSAAPRRTFRWVAAAV